MPICEDNRNVAQTDTVVFCGHSTCLDDEVSADGKYCFEHYFSPTKTGPEKPFETVSFYKQLRYIKIFIFYP